MNDSYFISLVLTQLMSQALQPLATKEHHDLPDYLLAHLSASFWLPSHGHPFLPAWHFVTVEKSRSSQFLARWSAPTRDPLSHWIPFFNRLMLPKHKKMLKSTPAQYIKTIGNEPHKELLQPYLDKCDSFFDVNPLKKTYFKHTMDLASRFKKLKKSPTLTPLNHFISGYLSAIEDGDKPAQNLLEAAPIIASLCALSRLIELMPLLVCLQTQNQAETPRILRLIDEAQGLSGPIAMLSQYSEDAITDLPFLLISFLSSFNYAFKGVSNNRLMKQILAYLVSKFSLANLQAPVSTATSGLFNDLTIALDEAHLTSQSISEDDKHFFQQQFDHFERFITLVFILAFDRLKAGDFEWVSQLLLSVIHQFKTPYADRLRCLFFQSFSLLLSTDTFMAVFRRLLEQSNTTQSQSLRDTIGLALSDPSDSLQQQLLDTQDQSEFKWFNSPYFLQSWQTETRQLFLTFPGDIWSAIFSQYRFWELAYSSLIQSFIASPEERETAIIQHLVSHTLSTYNETTSFQAYHELLLFSHLFEQVDKPLYTLIPFSHRQEPFKARFSQLLSTLQHRPLSLDDEQRLLWVQAWSQQLSHCFQEALLQLPPLLVAQMVTADKDAFVAMARDCFITNNPHAPSLFNCLSLALLSSKIAYEKVQSWCEDSSLTVEMDTFLSQRLLIGSVFEKGVASLWISEQPKAFSNTLSQSTFFISELLTFIHDQAGDTQHFLSQHHQDIKHLFPELWQKYLNPIVSGEHHLISEAIDYCNQRADDFGNFYYCLHTLLLHLFSKTYASSPTDLPLFALTPFHANATYIHHLDLSVIARSLVMPQRGQQPLLFDCMSHILTHPTMRKAPRDDILMSLVHFIQGMHIDTHLMSESEYRAYSQTIHHLTPYLDNFPDLSAGLNAPLFYDDPWQFLKNNLDIADFMPFISAADLPGIQHYVSHYIEDVEKGQIYHCVDRFFSDLTVTQQLGFLTLIRMDFSVFRNLILSQKYHSGLDLKLEALTQLLHCCLSEKSAISFRIESGILSFILDLIAHFEKAKQDTLAAFKQTVQSLDAKQKTSAEFSEALQRIFDMIVPHQAALLSKHLCESHLFQGFETRSYSDQLNRLFQLLSQGEPYLSGVITDFSSCLDQLAQLCFLCELETACYDLNLYFKLNTDSLSACLSQYTDHSMAIVAFYRFFHGLSEEELIALALDVTLWDSLPSQHAYQAIVQSHYLGVSLECILESCSSSAVQYTFIDTIFKQNNTLALQLLSSLRQPDRERLPDLAPLLTAPHQYLIQILQYHCVSAPMIFQDLVDSIALNRFETCFDASQTTLEGKILLCFIWAKHINKGQAFDCLLSLLDDFVSSDPDTARLVLSQLLILDRDLVWQLVYHPNSTGLLSFILSELVPEDHTSSRFDNEIVWLLLQDQAIQAHCLDKCQVLHQGMQYCVLSFFLEARPELLSTITDPELFNQAWPLAESLGILTPEIVTQCRSLLSDSFTSLLTQEIDQHSSSLFVSMIHYLPSAVISDLVSVQAFKPFLQRVITFCGETNDWSLMTKCGHSILTLSQPSGLEYLLKNIAQTEARCIGGVLYPLLLESDYPLDAVDIVQALRFLGYRPYSVHPRHVDTLTRSVEASPDHEPYLHLMTDSTDAHDGPPLTGDQPFLICLSGLEQHFHTLSIQAFLVLVSQRIQSSFDPLFTALIYQWSDLKSLHHRILATSVDFEHQYMYQSFLSKLSHDFLSEMTVTSRPFGDVLKIGAFFLSEVCQENPAFLDQFSKHLSKMISIDVMGDIADFVQTEPLDRSQISSLFKECLVVQSGTFAPHLIEAIFPHTSYLALFETFNNHCKKPVLLTHHYCFSSDMDRVLSGILSPLLQEESDDFIMLLSFISTPFMPYFIQKMEQAYMQYHHQFPDFPDLPSDLSTLRGKHPLAVLMDRAIRQGETRFLNCLAHFFHHLHERGQKLPVWVSQVLLSSLRISSDDLGEHADVLLKELTVNGLIDSLGLLTLRHADDTLLDSVAISTLFESQQAAECHHVHLKTLFTTTVSRAKEVIHIFSDGCPILFQATTGKKPKSKLDITIYAPDKNSQVPSLFNTLLDTIALSAGSQHFFDLVLHALKEKAEPLLIENLKTIPVLTLVDILMYTHRSIRSLEVLIGYLLKDTKRRRHTKRYAYWRSHLVSSLLKALMDKLDQDRLSAPELQQLSHVLETLFVVDPILFHGAVKPYISVIKRHVQLDFLALYECRSRVAVLARQRSTLGVHDVCQSLLHALHLGVSPVTILLCSRSLEKTYPGLFHLICQKLLVAPFQFPVWRDPSLNLDQQLSLSVLSRMQVGRVQGLVPRSFWEQFPNGELVSVTLETYDVLDAYGRFLVESFEDIDPALFQDAAFLRCVTTNTPHLIELKRDDTKRLEASKHFWLKVWKQLRGFRSVTPLFLDEFRRAMLQLRGFGYLAFDKHCDAELDQLSQSFSQFHIPTLATLSFQRWIFALFHDADPDQRYIRVTHFVQSLPLPLSLADIESEPSLKKDAKKFLSRLKSYDYVTADGTLAPKYYEKPIRIPTMSPAALKAIQAFLDRYITDKQNEMIQCITTHCDLYLFCFASDSHHWLKACHRLFSDISGAQWPTLSLFINQTTHERSFKAVIRDIFNRQGVHIFDFSPEHLMQAYHTLSTTHNGQHTHLEQAFSLFPDNTESPASPDDLNTLIDTVDQTISS